MVCWLMSKIDKAVNDYFDEGVNEMKDFITFYKEIFDKRFYIFIF